MRPYAPRHAAPRPAATQETHPWRSSGRTAIQAFGAVVSVLWAAAEILRALGEDLAVILPDAWAAWLLGASAAVAAVAGALARIMAMPRVNDALARLGLAPAPRE